MTNRERAIVMAYTKICMLTGENLKIFYDYAEEKLGRPVLDLHLALKSTWDELHIKSREDFVKLCK